ncbi:MAG: hypothetical protein WC828_06190 [Thermoleophilia bacterium]|jgi:hypothetical protein
MMVFLAVGVIAGLIHRPLLVPWLLASCLFIVNYFVSMLFMNAATKLKTSAAAGVAVMSFFLRFGLLALALITVALTLRDQFLATAICFLIVYTLFMGVEIFVGLKGRAIANPPATGGKL